MNEQSGVCSEQRAHGLFLALNHTADDAAIAKRAICGLPALVDHYAGHYQGASLTGVVAVGAQFWDRLFPTARPKELAGFPAFDHHGRIAPATPFDCWLHLCSQRYDINYLVAREFLDQFNGSAIVAEEIHGFRYLDSRDLTGFVDGTENPQGEHRPEVALVGAEDKVFRGGSYVHVQRYVHDLAKWNTLDIKQQEDIFGRTKVDNIEYESAVKPLTAHTKRTSLKDVQGDSIEILRQSMPYGSTTESGLYFVSYAKTPANFALMLESMIEGDGEDEDHYDHMLDYTRAVTGAAFFAPARDFLTRHLQSA